MIFSLFLFLFLLIHRFTWKRILRLFTHGAFSDFNKLHQVQCRCERTTTTTKTQLKLIQAMRRARNLLIFLSVDWLSSVGCVVSRHWNCIQYLRLLLCLRTINYKTCKWKSWTLFKIDRIFSYILWIHSSLCHVFDLKNYQLYILCVSEYVTEMRCPCSWITENLISLKFHRIPFKASNVYCNTHFW